MGGGRSRGGENLKYWFSGANLLSNPRKSELPDGPGAYLLGTVSASSTRTTVFMVSTSAP
jgi:hypothetical protein